MTVGRCLVDLRDKKLISESAFERLRPVYDELVLQYQRRYDRATAETMATEKALQMAEADTGQRKRQVLLQAQKQGEWAGRMQQLLPSGMRRVRIAAEEFMVALDGHREAIRQQSLQMISALLQQQRKTLLGNARVPAELIDLRREVFGQDSGNAGARAIADSWRQTVEMLRSRFNAAGGRIAKMDGWHVPQRHDMALVRDAGFDSWRSFVAPLLDRQRMIDYDTGEPFNDGKLEVLLLDMWNAISSDGWTRNSPGTIFAGATANQRSSHRVLHFDGPDAWEAYAAKFGGGGSIVDAMTSHIEGMARDIAAMEMMGPNPSATLRYMQDWLEKEGHNPQMTGDEASRAQDQASAAGGAIGRLFDEYSGKANVPESRRMALGFSAFRSQQTAAKLGSALLSVGGDFGLMVHNAGYNGIPASKVLARYLAMINPRITADRAQAARHVLMSEQWADGHAAMWRTVGEELTSERARLLASGVLRASGLIHHTDVARQAFATEMAAHLTHMRERSFGQLDPAFRRALQRYDIEEGQWDLLRATTPDSYRETDWIYPETVAKGGNQAIADNFMRMLATEANFAVPVPDIRTRSLISSYAPKGRLGGEIIRSAFLFKGFPLSVLNMHGRRMLDEGASRGQVGMFVTTQLAMRYGLTLALLTSIGGALSIQVKELSRGRDPRPMDDGKFWQAALLQGGGLGIVGDLLFAGENRFGGGVAETALGPGAQTVDTALELIKTPLRLLDDDEGNDDQWKRALAKGVMSETPGMSLWYTRGLMERTLGDLLNEWAYGDDYGARLRRLDGYAEDLGTGYFTPPGEGMMPSRMPDFANALGDMGEPEESFELPN